MIKKIYFFFLIFFLTSNQTTIASIESSIVVKVDSQIITNIEIKDKILRTLILTNQEINQKNINNLKKRTLESLIQLKLKSEELSKHSFIVNTFEIDQYLNSISSNNIELLKTKLISNNLDYDLFIEEITTEIKWKKLIIAKFSKKINIDPSQIDNELKIFIQNNKDFDEYNLSEIEILIDEGEDLKEKIIDVENKIKETSFAQAATVLSTSSTAQNKGYIGWINSKSLSNDVFEVLNKMSVGEISKPILRQNSILILKINEKRTKKLNETNITELKNQILNMKKNELFNLYSKSFISQIKNNSFIEYK